MKVWISWVVATAIAFGVGGRLGATLSPSRDIIVIGYVAITLSLLLAGTLQWLTLRRLIAGADRWVPASLAAVALVGILVFGLGLINRDVGWVLGVIVGWIALGAFQWLVLREQVAGAGWWVLASALGLALAIPTVALTTWASGASTDGPVGAALRWVAFGGAYGVVTATALGQLLRKPLPSAVP